MAKIEFGPMVSAASGSIAGTTFARNRYGAYTRTKAIPVNPNTPYQQTIRSILAAHSQAWRGLTAAQRLQWQTWAQVNPITDVLGNSQVLQANAAYIKLNSLLSLAGVGILTAPPVIDAPDSLTSLTVDPDATLGTCEISFTPTPLAAGISLLVYAAVVNSIGVVYVKNLLKLCVITAAAQVSPYDAIADIEDRFGTLAVGQVVHVRCNTLDTATGLVSPPLTHYAAAV